MYGAGPPPARLFQIGNEAEVAGEQVTNADVPMSKDPQPDGCHSCDAFLENDPTPQSGKGGSHDGQFRLGWITRLVQEP